jgi:ribosomal protein L7/L12
MTTADDLPPEAAAAAQRGNVIEAIKITRTATGVGLKEAKDAVDLYLRRHGIPRPQSESAFTLQRLAVAVTLAILATVIYLMRSG